MNLSVTTVTKPKNPPAGDVIRGRKNSLTVY